MEVFILGATCFGLCVWNLKLQSDLKKANIAVYIMAEGMKRMADGEIELERTPEGIKVLLKQGAK